MSRKLTHEEFIRKVMEKNEYVRNGDIEILGTYVNMQTPIECRCNIHDIIWSPHPQSIKEGAGCRMCGIEQRLQHSLIDNDDFIARVVQNNDHVKNGEIEILGTYINWKTPIPCFCKRHNQHWNSLPQSLYLGRGCRKCGYEKNGQARSMPREIFVERLNGLNNGIALVGEYLGLNKFMDFICLEGHSWTALGSTILQGEGCPYCAGRKVWIGFNDLWTTRPDVAKLLQNPDDGYKYSAGSSKKLNFVCPDCGSIHLKVICDVCNYRFVCPKCSDGVSYPNKFAREFLAQLNVKNVKYEWNPDWLKPFFYDNYFEYKGNKYVLEMDGGLGHGKIKFNSKEKDVEGVIKDVLKDTLAAEHNVCVIRIDCDYKHYDRFEYIKNNMLHSDLKELFNMSVIDWIACDKKAQSKLVVKVAELYNNGLCISEIKNIFNCSKITIAKWLKQAKNIGLCDYDPREAQKRGIRFAKTQQYKIN